MQKWKMRCKVTGCQRLPYLGGLCDQHHREEQAKTRRREEAVDLLFRGIVDDDLLQAPELRDELAQLQRWWERALRELRYPGTDAIFGNEAEFAIEWCIILHRKWSMLSTQRAAAILRRLPGSRTSGNGSGSDSGISKAA